MPTLRLNVKCLSQCSKQIQDHLIDNNDNQKEYHRAYEAPILWQHIQAAKKVSINKSYN
ncbi:hypothetical protein DPMN_018729 [Dreissena polymorpha]|uniref:Uncharacterized protein n=1 Tax=Dreissena polymorpha TaxID=45954 RepID=A0A9D4S9H1_DREPO|nr:hypothetical protein DPMN_018601 [Dreissena polymorpha]KAH3894572.1 hypothetical protein DPMN_018729 [Dreissena polymorpha]